MRFGRLPKLTTHGPPLEPPHIREPMIVLLEFEAEVAAVIAELKPEGPKGFGMVMKAATARLAGRAEGQQVAAAARKLLGA